METTIMGYILGYMRYKAKQKPPGHLGSPSLDRTPITEEAGQRAVGTSAEQAWYEDE